MIPKIIHYCWFGRNPLPEDAKKCIESWRKFLPDYEIIEWNEDNFDVNEIEYTRQAYETNKFAFVSDYARVKILYEQGGLYFDTDVEVIKSFDDIVSNGNFMGFEIDPSKPQSEGKIAPGLCIGVNPKNQIFKEILDYYQSLNFILPNGRYNISEAAVNITTRTLYQQREKKWEGEILKIGDFNIYPSKYFNPLDDATGRLHITSDTYSIHWFSKSWMNESKFRRKTARLAHRLFGKKFTSSVRKLLKL